MPVREIKATYSSLTGKFASRKMDRFISWESALERDFYYLAEHDSAIPEFEEQPLVFKDSRRTYTPDVRVVLTKKSHIFPKLRLGENIIELKYRNDLDKNWQQYKPKFKLATSECYERGWKFKILTDTEIRSQLLDNIKCIEHHMRRESPMENELRDLITSELSKFGLCDIASLLNSCFRNKHNQLEAMPVLWRLIGDHSIGIDLKQPINRNSEVWVMN